jgi:ABC-type antimicrobial peptide transport system permease subunit
VAGLARESLRAALYSISSNRLRSFLTTVGIIVGIAAVIVLAALGNGMKTHFNTQFSRLANQITIAPAAPSGTGGGAGRNLTDQDVAAIRDRSRAPDIASVSPFMTGRVLLTAGQTQERATLIGANDNYLELLGRTIVAGNWFDSSTGSSRDHQVVLGRQALTLLWGPGTNPYRVIGAKLRLNRTSFKVIGVLDSNANEVIIPFDTARTYLVGNGAGKVDQIIVNATSVDTIGPASRQITDILDDRHHIKTAANRDYKVGTLTDLLAKSTQFINFLTLFTLAIAAISLIVGGTGVANIMLVSVTQRTREIGIRKAIGATRREIMRQFLSEAVILTGMGGIGGVALGIGITLAAGLVLPSADSTDASGNFPAPILSASSVVIAFGVSLAIGLLAGGSPAYHAAHIHPIDALRFE